MAKFIKFKKPDGNEAAVNIDHIVHMEDQRTPRTATRIFLSPGTREAPYVIVATASMEMVLFEIASAEG